MSRTETTNTFTEGLVMDINPLVAPSNGLSNALNATLITRNGNENVLLNDMGNGRVGTALLPSGYIPVGTCELGGIIYIVSYNPNTNKCLIGSFPSPERNKSLLSSLGEEIEINNNSFIEAVDTSLDERIIKNSIIKKQISDTVLNPGDKFIICADNLINNTNNVSDLNTSKKVNFKLATIDSNGRIIYLTDLIAYNINNCKYYFREGNINNIELDAYRELVNSAYNTFSSEIAGNLYLVAELEVIDVFTVTWQLLDYVTLQNVTKYLILFDINTSSKSGKNYLEYVEMRINNLENPTIYRRSENETDKLTITLDYSPTPDNITNFTFTPCMSFGKLNLFETTVSIDFSLFKKRSIFNTYWRYYKDLNEMELNYDLNVYLEGDKVIDYVKYYFIPYNYNNWVNLKELSETQLDQTFYMLMDKKDSYSGSHIHKIPFGSKFEKDSLYLVMLFFKIKQPATVLEAEVYSLYIIYKCMYTTGVFNNLYLTETKYDFDKKNPEYSYSFSYKTKPTLNVKQNKNKDDYSFIFSDNSQSVLEYMMFNLNGELLDTILPKINDTSGAVSIANANDVKCIINDINRLRLTYSHSENPVNSKYVKIVQQTAGEEGILNNNIQTLEDPNVGDYYNINYDTRNHKLIIGGKFYDRAASRVVLRKGINVIDYYTPIAKNKEQLSHFGIDIVDNKFKFKPKTNKLASIAIDNSNRTNTDYKINKTGRRVAMYNTEWDSSNSKELKLKGMSREDCLRYLKSTPAHIVYTVNDDILFDWNENFPIEIPPEHFINPMKLFILNNPDWDYPIIPIVIGSAGLENIAIKVNEKELKGFYRISEKGTINLSKWIKDKAPRITDNAYKAFYLLHSREDFFRSVWLFIKGRLTEESNEYVYIPLNSFFYIYDTDMTSYINGTWETVPGIIASFLMTTFVKHTNEGNLVDIYIPSEHISYLPNRVEHLKFNTNITIDNKSILYNFKGMPMLYIQLLFSRFLANSNCLYIKNKQTEYDFDTAIDINIPDTMYLIIKEEALKTNIESYVESPFAEIPNISITIPSNFNLLGLNLESLTLTEDATILPKVYIDSASNFSIRRNTEDFKLLSLINLKTRNQFSINHNTEDHNNEEFCLIYNKALEYLKSNISLIPLPLNKDPEKVPIDNCNLKFNDFSFINPIEKQLYIENELPGIQ